MLVWIIRHGKAEQQSVSGSDFDRELRGRGRRQAQWLAGQFEAREDAPGRVISSPAARARQTGEIVSAALGVEIDFDDRLLVDEPAGALVDLLEEVAAGGAASVALVGHNPQLSALASALGDDAVSLRTGQAALLDLPGEIEPGAGAIVELLRLEEG
ncbi:MAG: SixA phosphatase family protein [Phycisphaerales bacterium JB039]